MPGLATSLYGAVVAGDDGRPRVMTYERGGCLYSALLVASSDGDALAEFRRTCGGGRRDWAVVKYPRDSSEQFSGANGYVASVAAPTSLEDGKLAVVLRGFLARVERRARA